MAAKKLPVVRVAVCGLTSSSFPGMSGQGAGKSCLCNRFVRPKRDDLCLNHSSILTNSDYGSSVVNNTHFLYWGEKIAALEDGSMAFQIVEQTEFVEDGALRLYPFDKPYHKRCMQQKLVSGGKVEYVHPNQLVVPDEYTNAGRFPEKFVVDGYIVCIDVSADLDSPSSQQREFLGRLLPALMSVRKVHIVVALTKFDIAREASITAANELLAKCKRQLTVIEVSALEGVNVDVCFLVLAHLVDSKRPRTRIPPFSVALGHLKERVRKNEESFQNVLTSKITDFSLPVRKAQALLENEVEYLVLQELRGRDRVEKMIKAHLRYLREGKIKSKMANYLDHLQPALQLFLFGLSLVDTLESCKETIRNHEKFSAYFTENALWRDDNAVLKQETVTHVPISILEEPEGKKVLQQHMDKALASQREELAYETIFTTLESTPNLVPGRPMEEVLGELGLADQLAAVSSQRALQIYQERMVMVEQECVSDIIELLLEHPHLFDLQEGVALSTINTQLKDDVRYQRLEHHSSIRTSAIIKHIGVMKWPDKSPFAESHILETNPLEEGAPSQEVLSKRHSQSDQIDGSNPSNWILDVDSQSFNVAVLGRTNENALTLRSDFMNHMSGSGVCEVYGQTYKMELAVYHGNITTLHTQDFTPQGAVAVVNSKECLIWLEQVLHSLWIPGGDTPPSYLGLPLVILALEDLMMDTDASSGIIPDTPLCRRAKHLADSVQCVLMVERPTVQPKRLVVISVISNLISTLLDSVTSYADFLTYDLIYRPNALNVAMFTLAGDPYPPLDLLSPWLRHQGICRGKEGKSLFINCTLEKQQNIVNLTFHSSLNVLEVKKKINAGYILVYSPHRQASLAITRHLLSQLMQIPILIVAMVTESCDSHVIKEGQQLAEQYGGFFIASNSPEWGVGWSSEFFSKCWFSRFSSWQTQGYNPRGNKDRPLPQPTPGNQQEPGGLEEPSSAPTPHSLPLSSAISSSSLQPQSALRPHSIAGLLNSDKPISPPPLTSPPPPPSINTRSLPRPRRHKKMGGKPQEEDIYSDPVDIAMGNKQKKATLQRRQKRDTLPRTAGTPITGPNQTILMHLRKQSLSNDDDSYADPKDIIKFGNSESFLPSPSTSPPPPPATPPAVNGNPLVGRGEELYDAVRPPSSKNTWQPPSSGTGCGYDHLSRQVSWKYDHLAGDEAAVNSNPSGRGERPLAPLPDDLHNEAPPVLYAVVGTKTKQNPPTAPQKSNLSQEAPLPDNLYAIVNKPPKSRVPPPARDPEPPPTASGELYATVDTSKKKKMSLTTLTVAGGNGTLPVETARRQPIPSPSSVAHGNHPTAGDSDQLYATVDTSKKRKRTPPPVMPKSPRSPVPPTLNGGPPEFSRGALDRQRKPTKPLVGNGTQFRRKSHDSVLSPAGGVAGRGSTEQLHSQQTENAVQSLYATPMRKAKKPVPPATAPKPGFLHPRSPSPASGSAATSKSLPRGKSFDNDDRVARTDLPHNRTGSPLLGRKVLPTSPGLQLIWADKPYMLDQRMRTTSDPHFSNVGRGRERTHRRGRVGATYTKRAESSEDVWRGGDSVMGGGRHYMYTKRAESSEDVWRGDHEIGGDGEEEDVDEADAEPVLPERKYSASEMGLEDEPPPLPPRNYNWSDVEDDDEDLFQSEDELEETSTRITLEDQQAMYSSLRLYQTRTNSMSGIEELYAIVNQVAKEQEATQQPSSLSQPVANEVANVYDTLESALKQKEHLKMKSAVVASMSQSAERNAPHMQSALGAIGGAGAAVFTPKQLKLIKQQQKLLDKLQKKTEREAIRRRKSEVRRKRREEEEQRKRDGRRKGKKRGPVKEPERQRYFGSPLEAVVEPDGVPRFIKQCTQIIEAKGLKIEGMYRVSGKKDACLSLQDQYDMDSQLDVASMGLCETAISSTLKAFFKLLPEPLISNAVAAKVLDINAGELSEQKKKLELILQQMPAPNLSTLRYLMHHLHTVHQHQEINKMSSSNLAIVFWPTLMRPPLSDLADPSKQLGWQLMMARLIEHPDIVPEVC